MSFDSLKSLFIEAQDSKNQHQMAQAFSQLYSSMPFDDFVKEFIHLCRYSMMVYQREPAVEKTILFISKSVAHLARTDSESKNVNKSDKEKEIENQTMSDEEEEEDEEMHPLLLKFFEFLLEVHSAKERAVRFRVCQMISSVLQNLGEGAQIDDSLYDDIYKCMLERVRDRCPAVRVHAVLALSRLQNPSDESCLVTKAYLILVTRDPNVEVRRIVLTCLVPSATSLPVILERTHDVKDTVRITAYSVIAEKVPFRALKIEQRIQLLQDGLNDRSEAARTAFSNKVLQAWITACEGNVLEFLSRLDVQSCVKTCDAALSNMMKNSGILDLIQKFDIINENALIDLDKLTCEGAFYWSRLIRFVRDAGHTYDEQLDLIRPNCLKFCSYVENFTKKLAVCQDEDEMMDLEFIMEQLLLILSFMDVSDQASRKVMQSLLHNLIMWESVWPSLMVHIMPCLKLIHTDVQDLAAFLAEIISEIREPITKVENSLSKGEQRDLDVKIAGIKIKIHQLREDLSICIQNEDFEKAAELKANIADLDVQKSAMVEEAEPKVEEVRTQKNDPLTLLKCLTLVCEFLALSDVKKMTPTLQTLMETEVLPGMTNEVAEIRNYALKAIGLYCLIKKDIIFQHLPLLLQASQIDTQMVRITALKAIFDLIHVFGLNAFNENDTSVNPEMESSTVSETEEQKTTDISSADLYDESRQEDGTKNMNETANKLITILSAALDNECSDIRLVAVEGFSKLLLSGRLISSNLMSHLLLLWFNPLTEDDPSLLQTLAVFFPLFAFTNSANQQLIEETFVPTLLTILRAPSSSPLAEVNELNVASFLCRLTDAEHLIDNQRAQSSTRENPCHDSLAVKLCNEILSSPDSFHVKFWLKILGQLFISPENIPLLRDLVTLCDKMAMVVTEKQCVKLIDDLVGNIKEMMKEAQDNAPDTTSSEQDKETDDAGEDRVNKTPEARLTKQDENIASTPATTNLKTPANPRSTRATRAKSTAKATRGNADFSQLDDNVFATPAQTKARRAEALEETRVNLENLLLENSAKKPRKSGKTPKRPLHNIQDPGL